MILIETYNDILKSIDCDGFTSEFGGLGLRYYVIQVGPSMQNHLRRSEITPHPGYDEFSSLGVKIRFEDGTEAITVPTHAFVRIVEHGLTMAARVFDFFANTRQDLGCSNPISLKSLVSSLIQSCKSPRTNSPMNKAVFHYHQLIEARMPGDA